MQGKEKRKRLLKEMKEAKDAVIKYTILEKGFLEKIESLEQEVKDAGHVQSNMKDFYEVKSQELQALLKDLISQKLQRAKRAERRLGLYNSLCKWSEQKNVKNKKRRRNAWPFDAN